MSTTRLGPAGVGLVVGATIFLLGYERGAFALTTHDALAIGILWALAVTGIAAPWTLRALRGLAAVPAVALLALAMLSLLSSAWGNNTEAALNEFDRCVLYAAVYVLALTAIRIRHIGVWCEGIAWGITLVGLVGLASRLAPQIVSSGHAYDLLPIANIRLSYPIGYWNALAVLIALAIPLLLRGAVADRPLPARALSILPIPPLAATVYLTSSRSGVLSAVAGSIVLILLSARRWAVLAAFAVAGAGSAVAVLALVHRRELANGPLDSAVAVSQRGGAALVITLASVGAAAVYAAVVWAARRIPARFAAPERLAAVVTVLVVAAAFVAAHPVRLFDNFRSAPAPSNASPNYVQEHLLSSSGNGRWQLWTAAVAEFRAHPIGGGGTGSFQAWWTQHRSYALFVENAHSLYLEVLGELGFAGLLPLIFVIAAGGVAAARIVRRERATTARLNGAALAASFTAFAIALGLDWMWQVTAVTAVAFVVLALLMRQASTAIGSQDAVETGTRPLRPEVVVAVWVAAAIGLGALIYAQAAPLLAQRKLEASYAASRDGNPVRAYRDALDARALEPWASSTYLQLALVDEQAGRLAGARHWIRSAIDRDPRNWQLWVVSARLSAKGGAVPTAVRELAQARALNPLALGGSPAR